MRIALALFLILLAQTALAGSLTYDIGPYRAGGFAASYLHTATGCRGGSDLDMNRNGSNDTLYMCGNAKRAVGGQITGDWDGERLTRISGTIGGRAVVGGRLGGNYYRNVDGELRPRWFLTLAGLGRFFFEQMPINQISGTQLTLWGQNRAAYVCKTARCRNRHRARGIDLYGRAQTALPEPGSLGVLLAGLAGLSLAIRQRRLSIAKVFPAAR